MTEQFEQAKREFVTKYVNNDNEPTFLPDLNSLLEQHKEVILYEQEQELTELKKKLGLLKESMKNNELDTTADESKSYPAGLKNLKK